MMIRHHCHSWLDDGGSVWSCGGGVGLVGVCNILEVCCFWMVGCCWMIGGGWTTTPNMFYWACCKFWRCICDILVSWLAMAFCIDEWYCSFSFLCCSTIAWSSWLVSSFYLISSWLDRRGDVTFSWFKAYIVLTLYAID